MPFGNMPSYLLLFRDDMRLSTWILCGAAIQSLLFIALPHYLALLPAMLTLGVRVVLSILRNEGFLPYDGAKGVVPGRSTAQIPNSDGTFAATASAKDVCVFIISARSNHPKGRFAPGMNEMGGYLGEMWQEAIRNREKWGYLGKTPTLIATEEDWGNILTWISYWRSLEDLHAFARTEAHRAGWDWFNREQKKYPHIGIQHETYFAPKGHWENIAHNFRPFGIRATEHVVRNKPDDAEYNLISPLQATSGTAWKSMKTRMAMMEK